LHFSHPQQALTDRRISKRDTGCNGYAGALAIRKVAGRRPAARRGNSRRAIFTVPSSWPPSYIKFTIVWKGPQKAANGEEVAFVTPIRTARLDAVATALGQPAANPPTFR